MNLSLEQTVRKGLFEEVRSIRRHVVERYDSAAEALEEADSWDNLRMPSSVRQRLRETDAEPIEFIDTIRYRLLMKKSSPS
jgi:hypothetical protein